MHVNHLESTVIFSIFTVLDTSVILDNPDSASFIVLHKEENKPIKIKIFLFSLCLITAGLFIVITAALMRNDIGQGELVRQDGKHIDTIYIYTDKWHNISIPMSVDNLHNIGIIFKNEDLEKNISKNWLNTLGLTIFFDKQETGDINIDIDTRDIVRIRFAKNNKITLNDLEMGTSRRRDIINTFGKPFKIFLTSKETIWEYHINNQRVWFWLHSDSSPFFQRFDNKSVWVAITIISMDAVSSQGV